MSQKLADALVFAAIVAIVAAGLFAATDYTAAFYHLAG